MTCELNMDDLMKIAPQLTDVWLFHGPNQTKRAEQLRAAHERVTLVPHSGKGKNALDFHLSFYLGYVAAKHPEATLLVVANMGVHATAAPWPQAVPSDQVLCLLSNQAHAHHRWGQTLHLQPFEALMLLCT